MYFEILHRSVYLIVLEAERTATKAWFKLIRLAV